MTFTASKDMHTYMKCFEEGLYETLEALGDGTSYGDGASHGDGTSHGNGTSHRDGTYRKHRRPFFRGNRTRPGCYPPS